ncbi:MAG: hypothetical protein FRX49_09144 [Trebouxia sp. A1-2]|nr:MAG: hypothetical protein FRX49_09144 [Trebouxia sp. A1-2]
MTDRSTGAKPGVQNSRAATRSCWAPANDMPSVLQATKSAAIPGAILPTSSRPRFLAPPWVPTKSAPPNAGEPAWQTPPSAPGSPQRAIVAMDHSKWSANQRAVHPATMELQCTISEQIVAVYGNVLKVPAPGTWSDTQTCGDEY